MGKPRRVYPRVRVNRAYPGRRPPPRYPARSTAGEQVARIRLRSARSIRSASEMAVRSIGIVRADQSVCRRFAAQPNRPARRPLTGTPAASARTVTRKPGMPRRFRPGSQYGDQTFELGTTTNVRWQGRPES